MVAVRCEVRYEECYAMRCETLCIWNLELVAKQGRTWIASARKKKDTTHIIIEYAKSCAHIINFILCYT